jgi:hypothetical protein
MQGTLAREHDGSFRVGEATFVQQQAQITLGDQGRRPDEGGKHATRRKRVSGSRRRANDVNKQGKERAQLTSTRGVPL